MDGKKKEELELAIKGIGATAEMSLIFLRASVEAGATTTEAIALTKAYLEALIYGNVQNRQPESEEE